MVDIVTAALAIGLLALLVKVPQPKRLDANQAVTPKQVLLDVRFGLKYAFTWKGLFVLLLMAALVNMVTSPAFTLLPLHVKLHFGKGVEDVAIMESAFGIGVVIGGVLLGVWGGFKRKMATIRHGLVRHGCAFFSDWCTPCRWIYGCSFRDGSLRFDERNHKWSIRCAHAS